MSDTTLWSLMIRTGMLVGIFGLFVFIPAGKFYWLEAWICLIIVFIIYESMVIYFWKYDRELIQSRGSFNQPKEKWDIVLFASLIISLFSIFIIAGLDFRFELSNIPEIISLSAFGLVIIGLFIYFLVMKENTYLSKVVEVQEDQKVISTGPYKYVRHPLYLGNSIAVIGVALSLGSLFALVPALIFIFLMIVRLIFEEKALEKELQGYFEYKKKVRYRLVPYIW
ncbi:MAG: methyltransferase family protein [Candidatus Thorarchaeota archaeon]